MEDYEAYLAGGVLRHAAIFVKDGAGGFYFFHNMTQAEYQAKFNELTGRGLVQTSINVINVGGQDRYAGIWRSMPGQWATYVNMDAAGFQSRFNDFAGQGFRWYKVQGYNNSSRFGAVWTK